MTEDVTGCQKQSFREQIGNDSDAINPFHNSLHEFIDFRNIIDGPRRKKIPPRKNTHALRK